VAASRRVLLAAASTDSGSLWRALLRGPLLWTLALFVSVNVAVGRGVLGLQERRQQNVLARPLDPAREIRFDYSLGDKLGDVWGHIPDAEKVGLVVVAGMSQMYAVNDPQPGDQIIAEWIDDAVRGRGRRAFGLAAPNLTNEEAVFLLLATLSDPHTRPEAFVFGVCFDKFRNLDLRPSYLRFLRARPELQALVARTVAAQGAAHPSATAKLKASLDASLAPEKAGADDTSLESRLRGAAGAVLPLVAYRTDVNAALQESAYFLRNRVLGIKASTKRPQLPSRYQLNLDFLSLLADVARAHGVTLLPYIIPLNPLAENPYVPEEHRRFKGWYAGFAREKGLLYLDLEDLVPTDEWGMRFGEIDFKHFRGAGHRRTAEAIVTGFGEWLLSAPPGPARP
jgi:hypothetical protein